MFIRLRPYLTLLLLVANVEPRRICLRADPHFGGYEAADPICLTVPDYDTRVFTRPWSLT